MRFLGQETIRFHLARRDDDTQEQPTSHLQTKGMHVANIDNVDIGIIDQFFIRSIRFLNAMLLGKLGSSSIISRGTGHDACRGYMLECLAKVVRDASTSNQTPTQGRTFQGIRQCRRVERTRQLATNHGGGYS